MQLWLYGGKLVIRLRAGNISRKRVKYCHIDLERAIAIQKSVSSKGPGVFPSGYNTLAAQTLAARSPRRGVKYSEPRGLPHVANFWVL